MVRDNAAELIGPHAEVSRQPRRLFISLCRGSVAEHLQQCAQIVCMQALLWRRSLDTQPAACAHVLQLNLSY